MKGRELLSLAFRLIGLIFLAFSVVTVVNSFLFVSDSVSLSATVVDVRVEQNAVPLMQAEQETGLIYYPVVEYVGPDGVARQFEGRAGSQKQIYNPGDSVEVLVRQGNAESARIASLFGVWGRPIILGGLALIFLLVGILAPRGFGGSSKEG